MRPCNPDILIDWGKVPPPKYKKDYEGRLVRVPSFGRKGYGPKPEMPSDGSVCRIENRHNNYGGGEFHLDLSWRCPACDHRHTRSIPESWLADGKADFVEPVGLADYVHNLEEAPAPLLFVAGPISFDWEERAYQTVMSKQCAAWLCNAGWMALDAGGVMETALAACPPFALAANTALRTLEIADALCVLMLEGVKDNDFVGVCITRARRLGIPCNQIEAIPNAVDPQNSFRVVHAPQWWV